jgi:hypothetical protein
MYTCTLLAAAHRPLKGRIHTRRMRACVAAGAMHAARARRRRVCMHAQEARAGPRIRTRRAIPLAWPIHRGYDYYRYGSSPASLEVAVGACDGVCLMVTMMRLGVSTRAIV